jgi:Flp pilus assembly protein TadG
MARRSLLSDRRGAVAIIMASASIAMFGVVGIAIDFGNVFTARRALQGATDIAAIAAASNLSNATAAANANAVANNFQAADVASVTLGTYVADPTISPSARFQPAPLATANAVQVTMTHQQPLYFMDLLWFYHGGTSMPISTQATAAATQVVSFDLGSGTASLSGGIANAILGATVGGAVNMSLVDYQSLASAQVDLFGLANAVAVQLGQPNDSYAQAFGGTISMSNFIAALERVAPGVMPQLQVLATAAATGSATVDLSRLLEYGPYADLPVGGVEPQVTATASVMSLLQNASQVGGNTHLINLNINANIPGITAVTAMMTIGEPPVGTTVMAIDQAGASLHTAQIRLFLNITLGMVGTAAVCRSRLRHRLARLGRLQRARQQQHASHAERHARAGERLDRQRNRGQHDQFFVRADADDGDAAQSSEHRHRHRPGQRDGRQCRAGAGHLLRDGHRQPDHQAEQHHRFRRCAHHVAGRQSVVAGQCDRPADPGAAGADQLGVVRAVGRRLASRSTGHGHPASDGSQPRHRRYVGNGRALLRRHPGRLTRRPPRRNLSKHRRKYFPTSRPVSVSIWSWPRLSAWPSCSVGQDRYP